MTLLEKFNEALVKCNDNVENKKDIKLLTQYSDLKLYFASTPGHGYFGILGDDKKIHIVGEEDEGITNPTILEYFNINQYGELLHNDFLDN